MSLSSWALGLAVSVAVALTPASAASAAADRGPITGSGPFCAVSMNHGGATVCASSARELATAWARSPFSVESSVLIVILYDNANMDGSAGSWSYYGAAACTSTTSDIDYSVSTLGSFNNRTSSFQSYNNCATRLWSGTSYTGTAYPSSVGYLVSSTYVGAGFNDTAESAQFS
jgi:hypothetical protein